jgi:putative hydrolase of the HAD superfamily
MSSADYGIRKPHPLIFQTAAAIMDLDANEVWYAGNSIEHDVAGCRNAGMTPVYYTGNNKKKDQADVLTVDRWRDFTCILERL